MSNEQKHVPASLNMDARNFLHAINNSAQSKVVFFENVIRRLGQEAKKNFRLVALQPTSLMFEDVSTHDYFAGDIKKEGVRYTVDNIKKINVVEEKKADLFEKNCGDLVNAITEQDFKGAEKAFTKIELQRFRSRVIPESGFVMTRDGEVRKINVNSGTVKENNIPLIVKAFADAVTDSVEISEGQVVRGTFMETGEQFVIPIDELARRRVVARKMRQVAESAYRSPSFQKLIVSVASLVTNRKVSEAVELAAKFLKEEQEFCLLSADGMHQLVESSLSAQMEFNSFLINDVSMLMHKTNLKVNRDTIVECWSKTAQKAQNAELLMKAKNLSESDNFAADYNVFLESVFNETGDIDSNRAKAYYVALRVVRSVLGKMEGQEQLVQDMSSMISALESDQPATDVIFQAEELLASISDEVVGRVDNLSNFDRMPGVEEEPMPGEEPGMEEETPVPLPELGDEEPAGPEIPELAGAGAPSEPMAGGMESPLPGMESKKKAAKPLVEGEFTPVEKMGLLELQEELLNWKTDGHIFLKEDGFEDCYGQLNRYIDRCMNLGQSADNVRESFEQIRDVVIDSGNDVDLDLPVDPYAKSVGIKENAKIKEYMPMLEDLGGLNGPAKGPKHGGDASGMSELQDGEGLSKKETKKVDGTDAAGAPSTTGAVSQEAGLSMSKDHQNKTKGLAAKDLKKVSGQDASGAPSPGGAAGGDTDMSKELLSKSKSIAEESFIDKIASTLGEEEMKVGTSFKSGAGYSKSHDLKMDELQGGDGVEGDGLKKVDGTDAAGVPSAKGAAEGDTDMGKEFLDKSGGLAESEDVSEEVMSEVPGTDEPAANEDQYKGPRQHKWGKKKAAIAPREVKKEGVEAIADALSEDVAVFKTDDRLDDVIMKVLEHMKGDTLGAPTDMMPVDGGMGMPPAPVGDMPPSDDMVGGMDMPGAVMQPGHTDVPVDGEPVEQPPHLDVPLPGGDAPKPVGDEAGGEFGGGDEAGGEFGGGEKKSPPPFGGKGEKKEKKDDDKDDKKEDKGEKKEKKEKKDDDKDEKKESFDAALDNKLETLTEDYCVDCDQMGDKCKCPCLKCKKAPCVC